MKTFVIPSIKRSVAPTANENLSAGYPIGQHWLDTATGKEYYHSSDGVWEHFATTHEALPDKNSETAFQHVDTTTTKNTLDAADMVAIKDSVTGNMVLTPKSNLKPTVVQNTGTSETDVMSQKAVSEEISKLAGEVNLLGGGKLIADVTLTTKQYEVSDIDYANGIITFTENHDFSINAVLFALPNFKFIANPQAIPRTLLWGGETYFQYGNNYITATSVPAQNQIGIGKQITQFAPDKTDFTAFTIGRPVTGVPITFESCNAIRVEVITNSIGGYLYSTFGVIVGGLRPKGFIKLVFDVEYKDGVVFVTYFSDWCYSDGTSVLKNNSEKRIWVVYQKNAPVFSSFEFFYNETKFGSGTNIKIYKKY